MQIMIMSLSDAAAALIKGAFISIGCKNYRVQAPVVLRV
jgi:hypothetical protein